MDSPTCAHWIGAESRICASTNRVRRYQPGPRCPQHTPARMAGRPEPPEQTGSPWWVKDDGHVVAPAPISANWVHDSRSKRSGKRASGEQRRAAHLGEQYDAEAELLAGDAA